MTQAVEETPKHPDCDPCDCGANYGQHCKHAHLPWFGLTDDDRAVLDFEKLQWTYAGRKEQAIWERFGHSATRHYQRVNALLEQPGAEAYAPQLVRRLRRLRDQRRVRRTGLSRFSG